MALRQAGSEAIKLMMGVAAMLAIDCAPPQSSIADAMIDRLAHTLQRLVDDD